VPLLRLLLPLLLLCLAGGQALAQQFPPLTGRVVDNADLLTPAEEAALTQKLEALERASTRQLVVATVPDLQSYPIEDYGYRLGRAWRLGQQEANNGAILLVAPNERKVRIEVGYGLEPILTDALSSLIIRNQILPRFREGDYSGGISAGVDAIFEQLQAPPEEAERRILAAQQSQTQRASADEDGGSLLLLIFWGLVILFVILPMLRGGRRGRKYRRRGDSFPVVIWGPGWGSGGSWGRGGGFGAWGGGGGGGFGGFSGGGGSFGGGGASGGW
jgi:uncharacterized protein